MRVHPLACTIWGFLRTCLQLPQMQALLIRHGVNPALLNPCQEVLGWQVHGHDTAGGVLHGTESLWSEEGLIRAGSRQNMRKGQMYRASPPTDLAVALDRQRRLLHGQDLRNYWNLPKVLTLNPAPLHPLGFIADNFIP